MTGMLRKAVFLTALGLTMSMQTMALQSNSTILAQTVSIDGIEVSSRHSGHAISFPAGTVNDEYVVVKQSCSPSQKLPQAVASFAPVEKALPV